MYKYALLLALLGAGVAQALVYNGKAVHTVSGTKFTCLYKLTYTGNVVVQAKKSKVTCKPDSKKKGKASAEFTIKDKVITVDHLIKKGPDTITKVSVSAPTTAAPVTTPSLPGPGGNGGDMFCKCKLPEMPPSQVVTGRRRRSILEDRQLGGLLGNLVNPGTNNDLTNAMVQAFINELTNNPEMVSSIVQSMIEQGVLQDVVSDLVASGALADIVAEMVSSGALQDIVSELIASGAITEATQEIADSGAIEEAVQELIASGAVAQMVEEILKSEQMEQQMQEFMSSGQLEQIIENIDYEQILAEFMQENNGLWSEEAFEAFLMEMFNDIDPQMVDELMAALSELEMDLICSCSK